MRGGEPIRQCALTTDLLGTMAHFDGPELMGCVFDGASLH